MEKGCAKSLFKRVIIKLDTRATPRKHLTVSLLNTLAWLPLSILTKSKLKLSAASVIAMMMIYSISGLWKAAMLAFFVQNPQVEQADMAFATASNHPIPASFSATAVIAVIAT